MSTTQTRHPHPGEPEYGNGGGLMDTGSSNERELAASSGMAASQAEIQSAITVAIRFPRDEDGAYGRLINACQRPSFQAAAIYRYPRGGTDIKGPSVNMAREFARLWGNVRYGFEVVSEDEDTCHVRGFAWDMQTNMKVVQDASFKVLVYRRKQGWIKPDERDKRELVNKHGAICERNCLLKVLPRDMVEDAMLAIEKNVKDGIKNDLENQRKKLVGAFGTVNVEAKQIEEYLGHSIKELTPDEIVDLRQIYTSIKDGNSHWSDYAEKDKAKVSESKHSGRGRKKADKAESEAFSAFASRIEASTPLELDATWDAVKADTELSPDEREKLWQMVEAKK